eukprot:CAMPEP_0202852544 /NCGR_PEP_ID=MMETSP1389-20130828/89373_1 /ASSEMBLY_ACC=CAM_ASM_000865 /TAXON_ID=302021 /ORGANISM="Rhodomonas sp., Strain CCMP768" /LENGTH=49 /DNA_ID= /DNA_START= /DNA_END= /DNA_ORIENTATION=
MAAVQVGHVIVDLDEVALVDHCAVHKEEARLRARCMQVLQHALVPVSCL